MRASWYYGWNIIAFCLLLQALTAGTSFVSFPLLTEQWATDFRIERSRASLAFTFGMIGGSTVSVLAGRWIDTRSVRVLMAIGLGIHAIALGLVSMCVASWQINLVYGLIMPFGIVLAGLVPAQLLAARWFPKRRGLALGIVSSGVLSMFMPLVVNGMIDEIGWRSTLRTLALVGACMLPLVLLVLRNEPADLTGMRGEADVRGSGVIAADQLSMMAILRTRIFWVLVAFMTTAIGTLVGVQVSIVAYGAERGLTKDQAASLLSGAILAGVVAKLAWGYLADHVDHHRLLALMGTIAAAACIGLAFSHGYPRVSLSYILLAIGVSGTVPIMSAAFAHRFGAAALGRVYGLAAAFGVVTAAFAPAIAKARELSSSFTLVLLMCATIIGCACAFVLAMRSKGRSG